MKEKTLEQKLKTSIQAVGGICWKLTCPGTIGVPDRVCLKDGRVVFVELKAPGRKPRPAQQRRINQLADAGFKTLVVDEVYQIQGVLDALQTP